MKGITIIKDRLPNKFLITFDLLRITSKRMNLLYLCANKEMVEKVFELIQKEPMMSEIHYTKDDEKKIIRFENESQICVALATRHHYRINKTEIDSMILDEDLIPFNFDKRKRLY